MLPTLTRAHFAQAAGKTAAPVRPVKILQFGEGNFLRAFVDWMVQRANDAGVFAGGVRLVQPIAEGMLPRLAAQDYGYTVLLRGLEGGKTVDTAEGVDVVQDGVNPYAEWPRFLAGAAEPSLRFVVSNTTEAGIVYAPAERPVDACPASFPAKVAALLAARYEALDGAADKGLVFLPCELIEHNGDRLREAVERHLADWGLDATVGAWVKAHCGFHNTLVDRIVTGYPKDEAAALAERLGYRDDMLVVGEPFHLWVIEGDAALAEEWPLARAGLNVVVTDSLKAYRDRKVRVLNGAHTGNVLAAFLLGMDTVGEMMAEPKFSTMVRRMVLEEILPGVALPEADKRAYAESVFERFRNPFIRHELLSISLNSVSKWTVRVLPSFKDYYAARGVLPKLLTYSLAALIRFYRGTWAGDAYVGQRDGRPYPIRDDRPVLEAFDRAWREHGDNPYNLVTTLLADTALWGEDLSAIPDLVGCVAHVVTSGFDTL